MLTAFACPLDRFIISSFQIEVYHCLLYTSRIRVDPGHLHETLHGEPFVLLVHPVLIARKQSAEGHDVFRRFRVGSAADDHGL